MKEKAVRNALLGTLVIGVFTGCSTAPPRPQDTGVSTDASVRIQPGQSAPILPKQLPSRTGNAPSYIVFGKRYYVMNSSAGYRQRGLASWYGPGFHGRKTSSGDVYNMYGVSAAHKHLPIPTYARVTHLGNGRSVVVRVDDRGPFVGDRVIDLSYGAAAKLDMLGEGTAYVEVEALPPYQYLPGFEPDARLARSAQPSPPKERAVYVFTQPARTTPVAAPSSRPTVTLAAAPPTVDAGLKRALAAPVQPVKPAPTAATTSLERDLSRGFAARQPLPATTAASGPAIPDERTAFTDSPRPADAAVNPTPVITAPSAPPPAAAPSAPAPRPTVTFRPADNRAPRTTLAPEVAPALRFEPPAPPSADGRRSARLAQATPVEPPPDGPTVSQRESAVQPAPGKRAKSAPLQATKRPDAVRIAAAPAADEDSADARAAAPGKGKTVAAKGKDPDLVLASARPADKLRVKGDAAAPAKAQRQGVPTTEASGQLYLQVGAFSQLGNAEDVRKRLAKALGYQVRVNPGRNNLHTVRVGPLNDPVEASRLKGRLAGLGFNAPHVVLD